MSAGFRLPAGGRIDRTRKLRFSFDGGFYEGFAGDTLASALLANGVHLTGRSFKYHRPRGILAAGADEPNALVSLGRDAADHTPNLRATQIDLVDGLVAVSQNRNPSLAFDWGAINDRLSPLLPAGFYYKTFMWPAWAWKHLYEPRIRARAGLGSAPTAADPDRYSQRYAHCDVLIVGAGPAGLAAALAAAETGARVVLCDEQAEFGGTLLAETEALIDDRSAADWLTETIATLSRHPRVSLLPRTTAFGYFADNLVGLAQRLTDHRAIVPRGMPRERRWELRAKEVVLATGAIERPLVFADNDRPGIMLADAARTYVTRYGAKPGTRAVIATTNDSAYRAALTLHQAGVEIAAIADLRADPSGELPARARALGLPVRPATAVTGTRGRLRISAADLSRLRSDGRAAAPERVKCDLLLMSGGFTPSVHLFSQARGKLRFDEAIQAYLPDEAVERVRAAGASRGLFDLGSALADGVAAGTAAAQAAGCGAASQRQIGVRGAASGGDVFVGTAPADQSGRSPGKAFVDFQNDVTTKDLALATREGFRSIEHIKRYTTTGMATDQGKTSNLNALGLVAAELDKPIPQIGLTTFRMPYSPVTFGTFAGTARGDLFDPVRITPIHGWAEQHGAVFEDVGQWKRARYFPQGGESMEDAVGRECRATRSACGLFDGSTLGKIEVVGPDAAEFLNRLYVNDWTKLAPGRCRYGVMLREDGFVMDDGVIGRLAADRFHVTTTTGGAARVLHVMEDYRQTEWPDLDVWLTSVTEQWAVIAVQGPKARAVLEPLVEDIDIASGAMPHMSVATGRVCGRPARLFRVSFTGELGFEINVPAAYGREVWEAVHQAGAHFGITPYGTEAMHVMRAEKGYIIVGQETDGTATPDDVGLTWTIGKAKPDFVGKRSLARAEMLRPDRKQLVGLLTDEPAIVLEEGAQIVGDPRDVIPMTMIGHVTSSYFSPALDRSIALAMVEGGRQRLGETLYVPMPRRTLRVTVTAPVFHDPKGARLNG